MSILFRAGQNYSSSNQSSEKPDSPVNAQAVGAFPDDSNTILHHLSFEDLDKHSVKSSASAPAKSTTKVKGHVRGFFRSDGVDLNMVVTLDNIDQVCKEIKKAVKIKGPFPLSTAINSSEMGSDLRPEEGSARHLTIRDIRQTLGKNSDLLSPKKCQMYQDIFVAP